MRMAFKDAGASTGTLFVGEIHAPDRFNHATNRNSFLHEGMAIAITTGVNESCAESYNEVRFPRNPAPGEEYTSLLTHLAI